MTDFLWTQAALLGVVVLGVALGTALHRRFDRHAHDDGRLLDTGVGSLIAYVAGSVAFFIGLMLAFSVERYDEASDTVREQALVITEAFDDSWALPEASVEPIRRAVVCLSRSLVEDSFRIDHGSLTLVSDRNTESWWRMTLQTFTEQSQAHPEAMDSFDQVFANLEDLSRLEKQRLLSSTNALPMVVWFVIFLCVWALVTLQSFSLRRQPVLHTTSVALTWLVTAGLLAALVSFAEPFSSFGASVSAEPIEAVLTLLSDNYAGPIWDVCERLYIPPMDG